MIRAEFSRSENAIGAFQLSGHAEQGEYGSDLVCAAVSAIAQTALIGIVEVLEIPAEYSVKEGFLKCRLPKALTDDKREGARVVLATLEAGLRSIEADHPDALMLKYYDE